MPRTLIQASLNTLASQGANQGTLDAYTPGNPGNLVAADPVNLNNFTATGRDLLIIFNADLEPLSATLTSVAIATVAGTITGLGGILLTNPNVLTVLAPNTFVAGQTVTFGTVNTLASPPVASPVSGITVQILAATSTQFTAVVSLAPYSVTPSTGTVSSIPATHDFVIHSAPDPQGREATVGASCTGEYTVAPGAFVQVWIPAVALFQQTDGTVWIDADSADVQFLLTH